MIRVALVIGGASLHVGGGRRRRAWQLLRSSAPLRPLRLALLVSCATTELTYPESIHDPSIGRYVRYGWRPVPCIGMSRLEHFVLQRKHAGRGLVDAADEGDRALQDRLQPLTILNARRGATRARRRDVSWRCRAAAAHAPRAGDRASPPCGSAGRRADRGAPCRQSCSQSTTCFFHALS